MATTRPDWLFDDSPIDDPHDRAARMLAFADLLRHPKASGPDRRPLQARWQRRLVQRLYGPSDGGGLRQVSTMFVLLPRGARKTALGGVLALGHTIGPEQRPGGQVISAASDREQARLAFNEASAMIQADGRLAGAVRLRDTRNTIEHLRSGSSYVAISAEGDSQHGKTPSFILADELHVWRGLSLWQALKTGASKTRGSLTVVITTAGERPEGIAWDLYQYARRVHADPSSDPSFLPVLFEADPGAAWDDEDEWHRVNPGLAEGFPDLRELRSEALLARHIPRLRDVFAQTHLNRWGDGAASGWVEMAIYDDGGDRLDVDEFEGRSCWIGVDLAKSYDLSAIEVAFPDEDGGFSVLSFAFLPETAFRRRMSEMPDVPWKQWRDDGHLVVTPGDIVDDDVLEAKLRDLCERFDVQEIGFDPKFAAKLMARLIEDDLPAVQVPQIPTIMGPFYSTLQKAIIGRRFRHGGNPVLRWCVQNAVPIYTDSGLPFISKRKSTQAIDCLVAGAVAVGRADGGSRGGWASAEHVDPAWCM